MIRFAAGCLTDNAFIRPVSSLWNMESCMVGSG